MYRSWDWVLKCVWCRADADGVRGPWLHAGIAVAGGGVFGAAAAAGAWVVGAADGGPVEAGFGAALGMIGGVAHWFTLHRALVRQTGEFVDRVHEISGQLLAGRQTWSGAAPRGIPAPRSASSRIGVPMSTSAIWGAIPASGPRRSASDVGAATQLLERALTDLASSVPCSWQCASFADVQGDVLVALGQDGRVQASPGKSTGVLGRSVESLRGEPLAGLVHPGDLGTYQALVAGVLAGASASHPRARVRVRSVRGEWRVLEWSGTIADDSPLIVLSGRDVTDHARVEADLLHQVSCDPLTGLPNRTTMLQLVGEAVAVANANRPLAVLLIDLDRFKDVNDSLGHAIGDQLLARVGPRLRSALRPLDSIARLGGDEFAVLLPAASEEGARLVAKRLAETLDNPFAVDGMDLQVEASIGIAVSHRPGRPDTHTVEGLLREADIAMYRAKDEGAGIVMFDPQHDSRDGRSRLELSAELRRAIIEGQLVLHYQPVVDVVEGRLAGVEALVRWLHPERGLVGPGAFLPLAEQTGLILPLSRRVLAVAVAQAAAWQAAGHPVQIAVNMSPRWLQHSDVSGEVLNALGDSRFAARDPSAGDN